VRTATITRKTGETEIRLTLHIDGTGVLTGSTGLGFFDHMLNTLVRHAGFDLALSCTGDLHIDDHHTIEDVGICLGAGFAEAMGDKAGIRRFGHSYVPLDEALARAVVDISGRSFLGFDAAFSRSAVGAFSTEMVREFFKAFVDNARITMHLTLLSGVNAHHQVEAVFKAAARALREAVSLDPRVSGVPSTKGTL
jgi:imidazoleglycerol-phosphate dehydratase